MSLEANDEVPWQGLDPARCEIRILQLSPAQSSSESVSCHLQTVSLLEQPEYEALSYVWGESSHSRHIFLNGMEIGVTESLFDALTHVRDVKKPRTLWVDALCINQKDDAEKNIQVMMMGKIYSRASLVLVWLSVVESPKLLDDIVSFGNNERRHYTESPHSILDLSMFSWWRRAWTFQEAGLAKDLVFHIGRERFSLEDLEAYYDSTYRHLFRREACCSTFLEQERIDRSVFVSAARTLMKLFLSRQKIPQDEQRLLYHIAENRDRAATNVRDRVYAYLGMTHDIPTDFVKYELPLKEWNIYTTTKLIQHGLALETIRYAIPSGFNSDSGTRMDGLPSWCPDWTQPMSDYAFLQTRQEESVFGCRYAASSQTKANPLFLSENILSMKGVVCDTITLVGCGSQDVSEPRHNPRVLQQWCHLIAHSPLVHRTICDECEKTIYGVRHKCLNCRDFDLCSKCYSKSGGLHPGHSFTTIISTLDDPEGHTCNHDFSSPRDGRVRSIGSSKAGLDQVPVTRRTPLKDHHKAKGSSWEQLEKMNYPFNEWDTVQDAFRKVLMANVTLLNFTEAVEDSGPVTEAFTHDIAISAFQSLKIDSRPAGAIPAKEGYTTDEIDFVLAGLSQPKAKLFTNMLRTILNGKRLLVSNKGYIGWGPEAMMPGDTIAVLYGSTMPFALRAVPDRDSGAGSGSAYTLVGECYVHGLMDGEALQDATMVEQNFTLI